LAEYYDVYSTNLCKYFIV